VFWNSTIHISAFVCFSNWWILRMHGAKTKTIKAWDMFYKEVPDVISVTATCSAFWKWKIYPAVGLWLMFLFLDLHHIPQSDVTIEVWAVITTKFCSYRVFIVWLTKVLVIWITFALKNRSFGLLCYNRRFYVMSSIKVTACFRSDDVPWYTSSCSALR
jgi:hypothetical protein